MEHYRHQVEDTTHDLTQQEVVIAMATTHIDNRSDHSSHKMATQIPSTSTRAVPLHRDPYCHPTAAPPSGPHRGTTRWPQKHTFLRIHMRTKVLNLNTSQKDSNLMHQCILSWIHTLPVNYWTLVCMDTKHYSYSLQKSVVSAHMHEVVQKQSTELSGFSA